MSDSEDDYLSAKFLQEEPDTKRGKNQPRDYASIRREAQRQAESKQLANKAAHVSRREQERAAREEGLSRNLISEARMAEHSAAEGEGKGNSGASKAFNMMKKMGFKPGQALGAQPQPQPDRQEDPTTNTPTTITDADADAESEATRKRALPLEIRMREGRGGLGTEKPSPKRQRVQVEQHQAETAQSYTQTQRSKADDRKAAAQLKAAQRTCRELDLRSDDDETSQGSVLWLDPDDVAKEEKRKLHAIRMGERGMDEDDVLAYGDIPLEIEDEAKEEWFALDVSF